MQSSTNISNANTFIFLFGIYAYTQTTVLNFKTLLDIRHRSYYIKSYVTFEVTFVVNFPFCNIIEIIFIAALLAAHFIYLNT